MTPMPAPVKRRYDATRRRQAAARTRMAILDAARELFTERGYTPTPMTAIAERAGVALDTVYASAGRKPDLARLLIETAISGTDQAIPAEQRDYVKAVRAAADADTKIAIYAAAVAATAPRAWRASAGLITAVIQAIPCRAGRGMCRTGAWCPVVSCRMVATWLKVRLSGPPISSTWPRRPGAVTARSTRAATSVAETKLTGLSPRPNTTIFPEVSSIRPMIVAQVSMKAVARTMVQPVPLARSISSAARLARNSPIGWAGPAPTTETRTNVAPARAAAPIRLALPTRSTVAGDPRPGPAKTCTAEMTMPAPRTA